MGGILCKQGVGCTRMIWSTQDHPNWIPSEVSAANSGARPKANAAMPDAFQDIEPTVVNAFRGVDGQRSVVVSIDCADLVGWILQIHVEAISRA